MYAIVLYSVVKSYGLSAPTSLLHSYVIFLNELCYELCWLLCLLSMPRFPSSLSEWRVETQGKPKKMGQVHLKILKACRTFLVSSTIGQSRQIKGGSISRAKGHIETLKWRQPRDMSVWRYDTPIRGEGNSICLIIHYAMTFDLCTPHTGHLFHKFGITESDWYRIKQSIDSKCRTAWRRKQRGQSLAVKSFSKRTPRNSVTGRVQIISRSL